MYIYIHINIYIYGSSENCLLLKAISGYLRTVRALKHKPFASPGPRRGQIAQLTAVNLSIHLELQPQSRL